MNNTGYLDIIEKIRAITQMNEQTLIRIKEAYLDRMDKNLQEGIIEQEEYKSIKQRANLTTT